VNRSFPEIDNATRFQMSISPERPVAVCPHRPAQVSPCGRATPGRAARRADGGRWRPGRPASPAIGEAAHAAPHVADARLADRVEEFFPPLRSTHGSFSLGEGQPYFNEGSNVGQAASALVVVGRSRCLSLSFPARQRSRQPCAARCVPVCVLAFRSRWPAAGDRMRRAN
jgi:hypothetical protein